MDDAVFKYPADRLPQVFRARPVTFCLNALYQRQHVARLYVRKRLVAEALYCLIKPAPSVVFPRFRQIWVGLQFGCIPSLADRAETIVYTLARRLFLGDHLLVDHRWHLARCNESAGVGV